VQEGLAVGGTLSPRRVRGAQRPASCRRTYEEAAHVLQPSPEHGRVRMVFASDLMRMNLQREKDLNTEEPAPGLEPGPLHPERRSHVHARQARSVRALLMRSSGALGGRPPSSDGGMFARCSHRTLDLAAGLLRSRLARRWFRRIFAAFAIDLLAAPLGSLSPHSSLVWPATPRMRLESSPRRLRLLRC
jgi:hypothetical protein